MSYKIKYESVIRYATNRMETYTKRWAVTLEYGRERSSCDRLSVRLLTAALDALYAGFPLFGRAGVNIVLG